jgi:hypothetical protein
MKYIFLGEIEDPKIYNRPRFSEAAPYIYAESKNHTKLYKCFFTQSNTNLWLKTTQISVTVLVLKICVVCHTRILRVKFSVYYRKWKQSFLDLGAKFHDLKT